MNLVLLPHDYQPLTPRLMPKSGRLSKKENRFIDEALFLLRVTQWLLKAGAFDTDSTEFKKIKAIIEEWHRVYYPDQH